MIIDLAEVLTRGGATQIVFALKTLVADDSATDAEPLALHLVRHAEPAVRGEALRTLGLLAKAGRIVDRAAVVASVREGATDPHYFVRTEADRAASAMGVSLDDM